MFRDGVQPIDTTQGATAHSPGEDSPGSERPPRAIDGQNTTKWLDFRREAAKLVIVFDTPQTPDQFTYTTANDHTERDPTGFVLKGSTDNVNWVTLLQVTGFSPTLSRRTDQQWFQFTDSRTLQAGVGCPFYSRTECCNYKDGRADFFDELCVRAKNGVLFTGDAACEPMAHVLGSGQQDRTADCSAPAGPGPTASPTIFISGDSRILNPGVGCPDYNRAMCCDHKDGREFFLGHLCVVSRDNVHFRGPTVCQPADFVRGTRQEDLAGTCGTPAPPTSPPTVSPSSPDAFPWSFVGCFGDSTDRDLPIPIGLGMTLEQCSQACADYRYFALQYVRQCWCGNSYGKHGPQTGCTCPANSVAMGWKNCVYQQPTGSTVVRGRTRTTDVGCPSFHRAECCNHADGRSGGNWGSECVPAADGKVYKGAGGNVCEPMIVASGQATRIGECITSGPTGAPSLSPTSVPTDAAGRNRLPEDVACNSIVDRAECCTRYDGRAWILYSKCVPAKEGMLFPGSHACEPHRWVISRSPQLIAPCQDTVPTTAPTTAPTSYPTQMPTDASGRNRLPDDVGCNSIADRAECCTRSDGRSWTAGILGSKCVPSKEHLSFNGWVCEPLHWVTTLAPQIDKIGPCPDTVPTATPTAPTVAPTNSPSTATESPTAATDAPSDAFGRTRLPDGVGCNTITDRTECCSRRDGRAQYVFDDKCIPTKDGLFFAGGGVCEGSYYVPPQIADRLGYCPDTGGIAPTNSPTDGSGRSKIAGGFGCPTILDRAECCKRIDGRNEQSFNYNDKCVPSNVGITFLGGHVCEGLSTVTPPEAVGPCPDTVPTGSPTGFPTGFPSSQWPSTGFPSTGYPFGPSRFPTAFPEGPSGFPTGYPSTGYPDGPSGYPTGFPGTGFPTRTGYPTSTGFPSRFPGQGPLPAPLQLSSCVASSATYTVDGAPQNTPCFLRGNARHVDYVDVWLDARLYTCSRGSGHHFVLCTCSGATCAVDEQPTTCFVPPRANESMGCPGSLRGAVFSSDGTKAFFACKDDVRVCRVDLSSRDGQWYSDCQVVDRVGCPAWAAIRGVAVRHRGTSRGDLLTVVCTDWKTRACSLDTDNMKMEAGRKCVQGGSNTLCDGIGRPSAITFNSANRLITSCSSGYTYSKFIGGIVKEPVEHAYNGVAPCPTETKAIVEMGPGHAVVACGPDGVRQCQLQYS